MSYMEKDGDKKEMTLYWRRIQRRNAEQRKVMDVLKAAGILLGATAIGYLFYESGFSESNIIMLYLLGVLVTAIVTEGRIYSIAASLVSVIVFNFCFTEPRYSLNAYDPGYPVTFLIMLLAAFLTGSLAAKIKKQAVQSQETAYRSRVLLATNQLLQKERDAEGIIQVTAIQLQKLMKQAVIFYGVEEANEEGKRGKLSKPRLFSVPEGQEAAYLSQIEKTAAQWCFEHNRHAGAATDTLGSAKCLYLSVRGTGQIYGVFGIEIGAQKPDVFEYNLMLSVVGECGLALDKDLLSRKKEEAATQAKNEQLRANLLRSISHDLRTPLTSISGNAGVLLNSGEQLSEDKKRMLYTDIYDDALWLINLVENLLAVTRIENGSIQLRMQTELMEEVLTEVLRHISRRSKDYDIMIEQPEEFVLVKMDARLIIQVLINLIDNAVKYTPAGSEISISVRQDESEVTVEVADNGPGIPDDIKEKVFEMFYTAGNAVADSRRSLGLGLALCRSIIQAHGGRIYVKDNKPHGAVFVFTLPLKEAELHE